MLRRRDQQPSRNTKGVRDYDCVELCPDDEVGFGDRSNVLPQITARRDNAVESFNTGEVARCGSNRDLATLRRRPRDDLRESTREQEQRVTEPRGNYRASRAECISRERPAYGAEVYGAKVLGQWCCCVWVQAAAADAISGSNVVQGPPTRAATKRVENVATGQIFEACGYLSLPSPL
jgi:hypothetical protein